MAKICVAVIDVDDSPFPTVLAADTTPAIVGKVKDFFYQNTSPQLAVSLNNELQDWRRGTVPDSHLEQDVVAYTFKRPAHSIEYTVTIYTGVTYE
jgi:hypothetical protein